MHALNHEGRHFSVAGPLNVTNSEQGQPVLIQAGSSGPGQQLAARHAEVVFTAQQDIGAALEFATGLRKQVADAGRDPRHCLIMPGLMPIIGATEAEAHDKLAQLQSFTDQSNALAILAEQLAVDVSGFALDAPLPPLPTDVVVHSRSALLIRLARERA